MSEHPVAQRFGGEHTVIKLSVLEGYLKFFATALKNQNFELTYIDAFAGSGHVEFINRNGQPQRIEGSPLLAMRIDPPFKRLHLIDISRSNAEQLSQAVGQDARVSVHCADANQALKTICPTIQRRNNQRGVVFLDPFAMAVDFQTLQTIQGTEALDVWYLFPLSAALRNLARDRARVHKTHEAALNRILGTNDWQSLYQEHPQADLFGATTEQREKGADEIEALVRKRLKSVFPYVAAPLRLPLAGSPQFSLFFACSNPNGAAHALARKAAEHFLDPDHWRHS